MTPVYDGGRLENLVNEAFDRKSIQELALELGAVLARNRWTVATAESCTGGLVASAITEVAGSSSWFEQGIVSYSNEAKHRLLDVELPVIEREGAVSEAVVLAMAEGARRRAGSDVAVSVSGIAGPGGVRPDKPVGTVWIGWSMAEQGASAQCFHFAGERREVRESAVAAALRGTIARISGKQHELP